LKQRAQEAKFAVLSANLVTQGDKQPVLRPYMTFARDGVRVAIIGLSEPETTQSAAMSRDGAILDPIQTARELVGELRGKVDLLVVLSHLGLQVDASLAQSVPGIDLIVGGNTRQLMQAPQRVGNTLIVQQGYNGEWLGVTKATFDAKGVPSDYSTLPLELTANFQDDADMVKLLAPYRQAYPTTTPQPTWTPDPRTPTVNMTRTVQAYQTLSALMAQAATATAKATKP
ncbi:MAG: hypothetical protein V1772_01585, partial [Chloroflexota bacterium]